ncbi:hypothetical protein [Rhodobacter sp. 24-YEA-8]|uniref:hypothetical protein n=1 Tax=Rhodobacter sp. 24-YEA-8 TaxID=1884310 RepID=UPI000895952A|nr:hypothetical protein [Rhodobacter sp. 24-YEA-8]SEC02839.1 hypothetical protein SAMN05519105_1799 [Rhodobacter sp. 24-YEA-8]
MKRFITLLAFAAAVTASGVPVTAETPAAPPAMKPAEQAEKGSTLQTANAMINYGRSKGDALAMIAGVKMMLDVTAGTTIETGGTPVDLGKVLDEAVALAKDDPLIIAKADSLRDAAETQNRAMCYWEYWCDWYGYCEYWYVCY